MKKYVVLILLVMLAAGSAYSLDPESCGFVVTQEHINYEMLQQKIRDKIMSSADEFESTYIPISFHIIRTGAGQGGFDPDELPQMIEDINNYFFGYGIQFYIKYPIKYVDNDDFHDSGDIIQYFGAVVRTLHDPYAVNAYIGPNTGVCGVAQLVNLVPLTGLIVDSVCTHVGGSNNETFAHEMGHYLGLYHTFDSTFGVECPDGSNCDVAGDLICDTPADPLDASLTATCGVVQLLFPSAPCEHVAYTPPTTNLMSYYPNFCREIFSPGQFKVMQSVLDFYETKFKRYVYYTIDTTIGWGPFEVNFAGESFKNIIDWQWEFGDGSSGAGQTTSHTYNTNGIYTVQLTGYTIDSQYTNNTQQEIIIFGDTAQIEGTDLHIGSNNYFEIYANNTLPLSSINIPLSINSSDVTLDSISTVGCRTEATAKYKLSLYRPFTNEYAFFLEPLVSGGIALESGSGLILKVYFTVKESAEPDQIINFNLGNIVGYDLIFDSEIYTLNPKTSPVDLTVTYNCCRNQRGNVDNDPADIMDIADLVYLIEYSFGSEPPRPEPACFEETDVDASGILDVADIVFMVDYMFRGGAAPAYCF